MVMEEKPYRPSHVAEDSKWRQKYRSKQTLSVNLLKSQRHPWLLDMVLLLGKLVNNLHLTRENLENLLKMGSPLDHNGKEYKKEYMCVCVCISESVCCTAEINTAL